MQNNSSGNPRSDNCDLSASNQAAGGANGAGQSATSGRGHISGRSRKKARTPRKGSLSAEEQRKFKTCDGTIRQFQNSILGAGRSLRDMKQERLFRENFATFPAYCEDVGISKTYANDLIAFARIHDFLDEDPSVEIKPTAHSHTRPLRKVPDEDLGPIWKLAVQSGKGVTESSVRAARDAYRAANPKPGPGPTAAKNKRSRRPCKGLLSSLWAWFASVLRSLWSLIVAIIGRAARIFRK
jgi:hypothetical protein